MKKILAIIVALLPQLCLSQRFDNTWLLGYNNDADTTNLRGIQEITFPDGNLYIRQNPALYRFDFSESNTSLSDSSGHLLSFTNGVHIGNRELEIMENGEYITDALEDLGQIWSQWVLALPMPGAASRQIYFYQTEAIYPNLICADSLYYLVVDLQNPPGKVVSRGNLLVADTLAVGKMNAVKHANGRDWWVIVNENNTNAFYVYLVDPTGVNLRTKEHVEEIVIDGLGQSAFSPDGKHLAYLNTIGASYGSYLYVYDFERCTGTFTKAQQYHFPHDRAGGGCAFSLNSRYLYVNHTTEAYQYDLESADIWSSRIQIAEYDGFLDPFSTTFYVMQLAPNGKIYASYTNGGSSMHVIHDPDEPGTSCQYQQHGLKLLTRNSYSVPTFPNFRLGPLDGSPCDTLGFDNHPRAWYRYEHDTLNALHVSFHDLSYYEPSEWSWDFGDGSPAVHDRHPQHLFDSAGVYEVCLTVSNVNSSNTHCKTLYLGVSHSQNPVLQAQLDIGPNPFQDWLHISLSAQLARPVFRLYDHLGKLAMESSNGMGINEMNTQNLPPGLYFWELLSAGQRVKSGKLLKV